MKTFMFGVRGVFKNMCSRWLQHVTWVHEAWSSPGFQDNAIQGQIFKKYLEMQIGTKAIWIHFQDLKSVELGYLSYFFTIVNSTTFLNSFVFRYLN